MAVELSDSQMKDYNDRMQQIVRRTEAISRLRGTDTGLPWIVVTEIIYLRRLQRRVHKGVRCCSSLIFPVFSPVLRLDECSTLLCRPPPINSIDVHVADVLE